MQRDADGPPLSRTVYDRATARRTDAGWLAQAWSRAQVVVVSPRSATPVRDGRIVPRDAADVPDGPRRFLGLVGDVPWFAVTADVPDAADTATLADPARTADPARAAAAETEQWLTLREFGASADELDAALVVSAVALEQWHQRHGHCPRCGADTVETQAGWTRTCTADGSVHFPRTDPAVIMLIHDGGDRALLGRGHQWAPGRFSTLAGFVEPGESLEAAVAREVLEEVGVGVCDVRYVASQPWPFPASLMLGFVARLDGDPGITLDPVEMAEAAWFTRDEIRAAASRTDHPDTVPETATPAAAGELRGISPHLSISRFLIDRWLAGAG